MKNLLFTSLVCFFCLLTIAAQSVYVDSNTGNDKNSGTKESPVYSIQRAADIIRDSNNGIYVMKINPGIYIIDKHISVSTEKDMNGKQIIIEANILPDDTGWTPEKMPVIACQEKKGDIPEFYHNVASFVIEESHVTIRGIKFHGYFYPHTRYFPIVKYNKAKTNLLVEQCMFIGDANISQIQALFINGNDNKFDHCIFYGVRNTVVFGANSDNSFKNGNRITNSIIYGASQGIWTGGPDNDFKFENNIVANCRYVWVKGKGNEAKYSMKNCIVAGNKFFTGIPDSTNLNPADFEINQDNIIMTEGRISLRLTNTDDRPSLTGVDEPLPVDYMHVLPGTLGYELGAGLFKKKINKQY